MKLFDRFDKVYCINLDRRPDRLHNFNSQVKKYNLGDYERVSAIDGNEINRNNYNPTLKPGEIGIILTNLKILKDAKQNKYEKILIIEDDCYFEDEILNIQNYFDYLPDDWDLLYMGGNHNTHVGLSGPVKINEKVLKLHSTYSAHFIGLKSSTFNYLEYILSKYEEPLDVSYVKVQRNFNAYSFYPAIAKQTVNFSDIQNSVADYSWLIK